MSGFTDIFIRRPVLAAVISLVLLLLGAMGYQLLAVRETPDVQNPVVTVTTAWPGADPAIVESDVTEVLERELNGIEGVRTLSSSSQDGTSQITVEFTLERELEAAANDVRSRVGRVRRKLPTDVLEPVVEKADSSAQPVMFLRLVGEGRSLLDITDIADTLVRDRIENVAGVGGVDLFGAQIYAIRVELDAAAMAARGIALDDVGAALQAGNADAPAGKVEGSATQLTLHLDGGLRTPEEFGGLVVRADGPVRVYLRDIAKIRLGAENERAAGRADGSPSLSLAVTPQATANIIAVSDEVRRRLAGISEDLPTGVTLDMVYDRADAVRSSIHDVKLTLGVAFGLVIVVIFAFLRDARATLVPTLAIPVSIVGTFLVLWAAGFTVNVFTLFGLVLAVGLVVDDAIVVLENIVRRMEEGESAFDASIAGTRQIAAPVIATTLSLVAVFLPVIFTGGTTGRLFLEFGTTVAASVAISMVVALSLTPMLCSRILKVTHSAGTEPEPGRLARGFSRSLRGVMARPWLVLPVLLLALGGSWLGFNKLPREFFPTEDRNFLLVRTQAQEGTSFAWMDARMKEVEQILMPLVPERRVMLSRVASGPGGVAAGPNTGMLIFPLVPRAERTRSQGEIVAALKPALGQITAFRTIPIQFPTVGRGFSSPLQFVLQHADFGALSAELPRFLAKVRQLPGLSSVNEDLRLDRPEMWVHVDREKAAELGVSIRGLARTLQVLTSGLDLSTFKRGVRQYKVIVSLADAGRATPEALELISLRGKSGALVPLSNLVSTDERAGAAARFHYNRAPSATISANLDGITLGEGIARVRALAEKELPPGFRTALAGESKDFADSSSSLAGMFGLALALVYLLLAAQFDSFVAPISIMLSVPLALAGAFAGLAAMGMTLSFFGQVGLILLVGLVTKNGILIVEYARQLERVEGHGPWAAAEAAARLRFRPILMTSVATVGGAIPIALGLSGQSRASLGVAVVGGVLLATVLTLYVTPVVYAALASMRGRRSAGVAATLLIVAALPARAGEPLTLPEALRQAAAQNLEVLRAATDVDAAEAGVRSARSDLLPSLYGSAGLSWGNDPRSRLGGTDGSPSTLGSALLRADLALLDLSALAELAAARADVRAAHADEHAVLEAVLVETADRFVALQEATAAVGLAEARQRLADRLETLAKDRVEVGAAAKLDQTRASLAARSEAARVLAARTAEASGRVRLAEVLGLPLDAELVVVPANPLVDPAGLPTEDALDAALGAAKEAHPELVSARASLDAAVASRRSAMSGLAPTVGAFAQVGGYSDLQGNTTAPVEAVGATLTVPIFAGGAVAAASSAAAAALADQKLALAEAERDVEASLRITLRTARDAAEGLAVAEDRVALAREELERAEARYREGVGDNLGVVSAQTGLAEAERDQVAALGVYNRAVVGWYAAQGRVGEMAR